jgi:N-acetylglucosaminyldiphosphoundecaprenol N-acetyl-beta-D-mannosaminyltransferase
MNTALKDIEDTDLGRDVYCLLGIPVDATDMQSVLRRIEAAAEKLEPFLLSTPNINFLILSQTDQQFRESLILSDLCPADGTAIVWVARLSGVPIKERIAGSDLIDALRSNKSRQKSVKVFLFGGAEGVAKAACQVLNGQPGGLTCVGSLYPGFGSVDEMNTPEVMQAINASGAEFFVASLGAKKGQEWLLRNHHALRIPVRAHLGAALNFQAGTVSRAPPILRKIGFEWLWRIKEEPQLWRRYWNDGRELLRLVASRCLALAIWARFLSLKYNNQELIITISENLDDITINLRGPATARYVQRIVAAFKDATTTNKHVIVNLSDTCLIDARVLGLLIMLRKRLQRRGARPLFQGVSPRLETIFRLSGASYLLSDGVLTSARQE